MEKSFSLFANFKQTTPSEITLDRVYRLITTDSDLRDRTEKFRFYLRVGNKQMSACEKTSCPAFIRGNTKSKTNYTYDIDIQQIKEDRKKYEKSQCFPFASHFGLKRG